MTPRPATGATVLLTALLALTGCSAEAPKISLRAAPMRPLTAQPPPSDVPIAVLGDQAAIDKRLACVTFARRVAPVLDRAVRRRDADPATRLAVGENPYDTTDPRVPRDAPWFVLADEVAKAADGPLSDAFARLNIALSDARTDGRVAGIAAARRAVSAVCAR